MRSCYILPEWIVSLWANGLFLTSYLGFISCVSNGFLVVFKWTWIFGEFSYALAMRLGSRTWSWLIKIWNFFISIPFFPSETALNLPVSIYLLRREFIMFIILAINKNLLNVSVLLSSYIRSKDKLGFRAICCLQ